MLKIYDLLSASPTRLGETQFHDSAFAVLFSMVGVNTRLIWLTETKVKVALAMVFLWKAYFRRVA